MANNNQTPSLGLTQYKTVSSITSSTFSEVSSVGLPLDTLASLDFELTLNHTNSGSSPTLTTDVMLACISNLAVVINGSARRISLKGEDLALLSYASTGHAVESNLLDTTSSTVDSTINFKIPFSNAGPLNNSFSSKRPNDSLLDLRAISGTTTASLVVTWTSISITNVSSFNSATLKCTALASTGIQGPLPTGNREMRFNTITHDSSGALQLNLPIGGQDLNQYTNILLISRTSAGVLTDSVFTNVKLSSLGFDYVNTATGNLAGINNSDGIPHTVGLYSLPLYMAGRLTSRLVGSQLSQLQLELESSVSASQVTTVLQNMINFKK